MQSQTARKQSKKYRYRNPWHRPLKSEGGEFFETTVAPVEYRGFQIFHRFKGSHELVKDGVCLTIRAGRGGPASLADALCGDKNDEPTWLVESARVIAAAHGVWLPSRRKRAA